MQINVPVDIRSLIARKRIEDEAAARLERLREREAAREERRIRTLKRPLVRSLLRWARHLATTEALPARGLQIFRGGHGRVRITAFVLPDGTVVLTHVVAPFGGCRIAGRTEPDLMKASLNDLRDVGGTIDSGEVWEHVRRALRG